MEDKGVTISIINNNPGVVIKADTLERYEELSKWAFPAFKALRKKWAEYLEENKITPQNDVVAAYSASQTDLGKCSKCGAPNKISKQGKIYCSNTCWLPK